MTATTGDITSVLFGVPGEASSAATILDGHAMAKKGEAGRALGAALASSLVGALIGAVALAAAVPVVRPLVLTFGYSFIGFLDDWLKLSKRNSKGLPGRYKIVLQTLFFAVAILGFLTDWTGGGPKLLIDTKVTLPFIPLDWLHPDLGWFYVVFAWVVIVGTSNAVNITDGLDGLAIGPTIAAASTFTRAGGAPRARESPRTRRCAVASV